MAIVIENPETIRQIERLAAGLQVSPVEAVEAAVREREASLVSAAPSRRKASPELVHEAIERAQNAVREHGNPDRRTPDEIIGYNDHGLFD